MDGTAGPVIAHALGMLRPDGTYVLYGTSAGADVVVPLSALYDTGGASLYGLAMFHGLRTEPASSGLARLAESVVSGRLTVRISVEAPWTDIAKIAQQLIDRSYAGKAVLHIQ